MNCPLWDLVPATPTCAIGFSLVADLPRRILPVRIPEGARERPLDVVFSGQNETAFARGVPHVARNHFGVNAEALNRRDCPSWRDAIVGDNDHRTRTRKFVGSRNRRSEPTRCHRLVSIEISDVNHDESVDQLCSYQLLSFFHNFISANRTCAHKPERLAGIFIPSFKPLRCHSEIYYVINCLIVSDSLMIWKKR